MRTDFFPPVGFFLLCLIVVSKPATNKGSDLHQYKVHGIVRDAETGEGLMITNITVNGTTKGTTTDRNGRYNLFLVPAKYELMFSYMGYSSVKKVIEITNNDVELDVQLQPIILELPPLTPVPEENPAIDIIRRAIENKERSRDRLKNYRLRAYSKMIIDAKMGKGIMRGGVPDSVVTVIMETKTDISWEEPNKFKEMVLARKQSGSLPTASNLLTNRSLIVDFSDEFIKIENKKIVGPLSKAGLKNYHYALIVTTVIDSLKVYKIKIWPFKDHNPLLKGTIYITTQTYTLMMLDLELNRSALPQFFTQMHFKGRYELFDHLFWMPVNVSLKGKGKVSTVTYFEFSLQATSVFRDYRINQALKEGG